MNIRSIKKEDFDQLKYIWEKFYQNEFTFPDFVTNFMCSFVVEEDDKIISVGGVRTIAESVIMTNKDFSVFKRRRALLHIFQASLYIMKTNQYNQLHAFVQDEIWKKQLIRSGFTSTKGSALIYDNEA